MTFDDIVKIGTQKPGVEETIAWGTPALKRQKRFMLRLKEDGESIAVKLDWENHDRLLKDQPDVVFKTDHYQGHPAFLVRLANLSASLAEEIVELSWLDAPNPAKTLPRSK